MNNKWKWILGLTLATLLFVIPPFALGFFASYGMTRNTNEWFMPMMYDVPGMTAFGMMFLMWLTLFISQILIGLGIVWMIRQLSAQKFS